MKMADMLLNEANSILKFRLKQVEQEFLNKTSNCEAGHKNEVIC